MAGLKKDKTNRRLGKSAHACRICGAKGEFDTYLVREMMQGTRDEFLYFACGNCNCLQIAQVPGNLAEYYGSGYYSYQVQEDPDMGFGTPVIHREKILDVGCGGGAWLVGKAREGWGNLYDCDPFLEKGRHFGDRVEIYNCSIHGMEGEGTFDMIRMGDSFEHMADPLEVLKSACRLLKPGGRLYMTIPTYPNAAFDEFGPHWYQLDAPRHLFLHSQESIGWLSKESGLAVSGIKYNSNNNQVIRSYFYQHGIPYYGQEKLTGKYFTPAMIQRLQEKAMEWNEKGCGDHMEVYWQKASLSGEDGRNVIFQRFSPKDKARRFPYPPLYTEPNTDYICFTDKEEVHSLFWKIQRVEDLDKADLEPYLEMYNLRWELQPEQVQCGSLAGGGEEENLVWEVPMEGLPLVKLDLGKFVPTADKEGNYIYRKNPVYRKGKYGGRPLQLTIGVPVSNQIETIGRCLSHIKPLLDGLEAELLVIDTGSTDGTVEVCREYGARIIEYPWCDNMSLVRNEGIYHAKGEWYLSIDDDEWFEDVEDILQFFKRGICRKYNEATYIQRNYIDLEGKIYEDNHTLRMAKITPGLHFEGRIHDALVTPVPHRVCTMNSYAHHYGFANDCPEKVKEKFLRNTAILIQDIYEYPEDLRYLFQLANEYTCTNDPDTAFRLFVQGCAMAKEQRDAYRGKNNLVKLFSCLYAMNDVRLFSWADYLGGEFPMTVPERACIAYLQENLAFQMHKGPEKVLGYYNAYEKQLILHRKDPVLGQVQTFYGLEMVEHEFYIMDAAAVAFVVCMKMGNTEKALALLGQIDLETVKARRPLIFLEGLAGEASVYGALCAKLSFFQWEEWCGEILDAFVAGLAKDAVYRQQLGRLADLLSKVSVPSIIAWVGQSEEKRYGKIGERLGIYALGIHAGESSVQELCFCAWLLKEMYVKERREDGGIPDCGTVAAQKGRIGRREILFQYVIAMGCFAEKYYNTDHLIHFKSRILPPDILAVYRMAAVLAEGTASRENILLLKEALEIFPPFHEEIRGILTGLGGGAENSPAG